MSWNGKENENRGLGAPKLSVPYACCEAQRRPAMTHHAAAMVVAGEGVQVR